MTTIHTKGHPTYINAYAEVTVYHAVADSTFLCDWVANDHLDGHDWCPTVLEPGDDYTVIAVDGQIEGRYCPGCGYQLFGAATLDSARPDNTGPTAA
ncbi:hypothetical protein OHA18_20705 [Kribbella sp. NBC_00709]|uniref:hypothetical protein n=1 Tax=Kribbella sp. NBC_00709 TaxID=2975972 RepID=UPI002E2B7226|nr:hypothetical protein [Kribbella sp. NBC_00709]